MIRNFVALEPAFCYGTEILISRCNQVDGMATILQTLESFCCMFSNGYLIDDGLNAGLKEFLDFAFAFSKGVFYIVGAFFW